MIGNPFTDVPELCSQIVLVAAGDTSQASEEACRLSREFWSLRHRMLGKLIPLDRAGQCDGRPSRIYGCGRRALFRGDWRLKCDHPGIARCGLRSVAVGRLDLGEEVQHRGIVGREGGQAIGAVSLGPHPSTYKGFAEGSDKGMDVREASRRRKVTKPAVLTV